MPELVYSYPKNHLLNALPVEDFNRLLIDLEQVQLKLGDVLYESGCPLKYVYFPTTAVVSLLYTLESETSAEVAGIGNDGMLGISVFMGGGIMPGSAVVRTPGHCYRLGVTQFQDEINQDGPLYRMMLRYTQALMAQIFQTAACNRFHSVEQQLCRWLLSTLDRLPTNELVMTQELVASALGVRRGAITEAAGKLQRAGIISYRRGHISIPNRSGLEASTCECYYVIRKEMARLLVTPPGKVRGSSY